jgi:glutamate N-acetyltransferase / amino-acid N-acetyltransferase
MLFDKLFDSKDDLNITTFPVSNGLADIPGLQLAGIHCDVRGKGDNRLDLALIVADQPSPGAAVFTTNVVQAAPVRLSQASFLAADRRIRAVVANSGNANACTGPQGDADAAAMQARVAQTIGCDPNQVLVCSTGRIGEPLPTDRILSGIDQAAAALGTSPAHGLAAAQAILTSDTRTKMMTVEVEFKRKKFRIAGMVKGAGMIQPNMATMLAFIATDADVEPDFLRSYFASEVGFSFNGISIDGDMSTNDTAICIATGTSGVSIRNMSTRIGQGFNEAFNSLCKALARMIVADGEKTTKVVDVVVRGAKSKRDADKVARAIANSLLVKSSWGGNDPNWGRILDAAGYAGVKFDLNKITLGYAASRGDIPVLAFSNGVAHVANKSQWKQIVSQREFTIDLDLGVMPRLHDRISWIVTTDLTEAYVTYNKSE